MDLDTPILYALASCPFLALSDLEVVCGGATSTVHRTVRRLMEAGFVERIPLGLDKAHGYCLTGDGVLLAAQRAGHDPDTLCTFYGLGRRQLLARLPQLARLGAVQWLLVLLADELHRRGGELVTYQSGPVRWRTWPAGGGTAAATVTLDGQAALRTARGALLHVGVLWDGDDVGTPAVALGYRLAQARAVLHDGSHPVPPVLLITAGEDRIARSGQVLPPTVLWTTTDEARERGILAARWVRGGPTGTWEVRPLLEHLATLPAAQHPPRRATLRPHSPVRSG